jgi:glycosyltransferase involved in cell wall biosynthesis
MSTSMITMPRKLAVVPSYNEAASVGDVVRKLRTNAPDYDVLVVDDGSTDATARIAEDAGA